jgi:hypothetical protein
MIFFFLSLDSEPEIVVLRMHVHMHILISYIPSRLYEREGKLFIYPAFCELEVQSREVRGLVVMSIIMHQRLSRP